MSKALDGFGEMDGEHLGDFSDQIRQGPWVQARMNAGLCPPDNEIIVTWRDGEGENQVIPLDDVTHVTAPEEMGETGKGHTKIHFKEHLGKAAIVVATGVILGGLITIRKRQAKNN